MSQPTEIEWRDGRVPVSRRFDDPYFSLDNGLAETKHVFLDGNGLPERFHHGFHIAELGFGTGLNLLATLFAWRGIEAKGTLRFTTFEAFPMAAEDMIMAQAAFPVLAPLAKELAPFWMAGKGQFEVPGLNFEMITGDARKTLSRWQGVADAWFLDGFSPAKNPEMWEPGLMAEVACHTLPGGTAATYSAAGFVRRSLEAAGFEVSRCTGFGRKRHMTTARMPKV